MFVFFILTFTFSNAPWNVHFFFLWINFVLSQLLNIISIMIVITDWNLISWAKKAVIDGTCSRNFFTVRNKTRAFYLPGSFVIVYRSQFMFILIFLNIYFSYRMIFCCGVQSRLWFSSSHVWMWELDCEESWVPKNWCFWTVVLEKTLESSLDCKEIQPVNSKGYLAKLIQFCKV